MAASVAFRQYDSNFTGTLGKREFKRALRSLGVHIHKGGEGRRLFHSVCGGGNINERDFVEWYIDTY